VWKCNSEGRFVPTYDIWDLDKSDYKSVDEYLLQSSDIAEKQVRGYLGSTDIVIVLGI
jgi:broad-specificity NMP kinase